MSAGFEERIANLEKDMSDLKKSVQAVRAEKNWQSTFGMSQNDPGFGEMVRLGQEIRRRDSADGQ